MLRIKALIQKRKVNRELGDESQFHLAITQERCGPKVVGLLRTP
jgi:hypothetical protein